MAHLTVTATTDPTLNVLLDVADERRCDGQYSRLPWSIVVEAIQTADIHLDLHPGPSASSAPTTRRPGSGYA